MSLNHITHEDHILFGFLFNLHLLVTDLKKFIWCVAGKASESSLDLNQKLISDKNRDFLFLNDVFQWELRDDLLQKLTPVQIQKVYSNTTSDNSVRKSILWCSGLHHSNIPVTCSNPTRSLENFWCNKHVFVTGTKVCKISMKMSHHVPCKFPMAKLIKWFV